MAENIDITILLQQAWQARGRGDYDEATALTRKAELLSHANLGRVYNVYAQIASDHNKFLKAIIHTRNAMGHYREAESQNGFAHSLRHLADLERHVGHFEESEAYYRKALEIYRALPDTSNLDLANALRGFGVLLVETDQPKEGLTIWQEVKQLYGQCNLQEGVDEAQTYLDKLSEDQS